jgi:NADPH:quinone reductase-like Zn-dependent oxidoreductase
VLFSEQALVPLPDHLDWPEAATLPCAGVTAWNALFDKGRLRAGETVLVMGSGGVSLFALQFARMAGARVIATTGNSDKIPRLKQFGASEVIHYRENPDWEEHVRKWAGGGVDHVIEVGGAGTLAKSVRAVRMGGKIHLIGNLASLDGLTGFNPLPAMMKGITMQGIFVGSREMFEQMARAVAANRIHPVVDRVFPFDAAPEALGHIESGSHFGKVCIHVNAG